MPGRRRRQRRRGRCESRHEGAGGAERRRRLAAFHTALMPDYLGDSRDADAAYKKALAPTGASAAGARCLWPLPGAQRPRARTPPSSTASLPAKAALAPVVTAGPGAHRRGQEARSADPQRRGRRRRSAVRHRRLADRRARAPMFRSSICAWRCICGPIWLWRRSCWPTASRPCRNIDDAIGDLSPDRQVLALLPHGGGAGGAATKRGWTRTTPPSRDLKALADADPNDSESLDRAGRHLSRRRTNSPKRSTPMTMPKRPSARRAKRDWPLFYARAMAQGEAQAAGTRPKPISRSALKLSPEQPELLNYLGYSWVDQGRNIPEALAMLEKARSLAPL